MSFKVYFIFGALEAPKTNDIALATEADAKAYANDMLSRWMQPTGFHVRESDEPVSHAWVDGALVRTETV